MRQRVGLSVGVLGVLVVLGMSCSPREPAQGAAERSEVAAPAAQQERVAEAEPAASGTPPHVAVERQGAQSAAQQQGTAARTLTRVADVTAVCMVNNTYMGAPQIPVQVDGRTYFGCCEMCKGRLERDPSARVATDPVSGRQVDKATAVIARDGGNRVLYFENEETYRKYGGT